MERPRRFLGLTLLWLSFGCARDATEAEAPESYEPIPVPTTTNEPSSLPPEAPPVEPSQPPSGATPGASGTDKSLQRPHVDVGGNGGLAGTAGMAGVGPEPRGGAGGRQPIGLR